MEHTYCGAKLVVQTVVSLLAPLYICATAVAEVPAAVPQPPGRLTALSLLRNVVRIQVRESNQTRDGFGFIVGERAGLLYIATAYHVLADPQNVSDLSDLSVKAEFFSYQGQMFDAKLLGTHDVEHDLAVLTVRAPNDFQWKKDGLGRDDQQRLLTEVWFVGRAETWYVPASAGRVASDVPVNGLLDLEGLQIRRGSSGAPLIAASGIVGMVLRDSADFANALSISFIKDAFHRWDHPWSLDIAGIKSQALKGAIDDAKDGKSTPGVFLTYVELVSPSGADYVPVQLYIPSRLGLSPTDADTLFGTVDDAAGANIMAFEEPVRMSLSKADLFVEKTFDLPPGQYTVTLGVSRTRRAVVVKSGRIDVEARRKVSRLILFENAYELPTAMQEKSPFAFGKLKVIPKGDGVFSKRSELGYFVEVNGPGIEPASRMPNLQVKFSLEGGPNNARISGPRSDAHALPLAGVPGPGRFIIIATVPLGDMKSPLAPGEYALKLSVMDAVTNQSYTVERPFHISE
jgi:Trypsin-like peptidase domain